MSSYYRFYYSGGRTAGDESTDCLHIFDGCAKYPGYRVTFQPGRHVPAAAETGVAFTHRTARIARIARAARAARAADPAGDPAGSPAEDPAGDPVRAALVADPALWTMAAMLHWPFLSERALSIHDVETTLAKIDESVGLDVVRGAVLELVGVLTPTPLFARLYGRIDILVQFILWGSEFVRAATTTPDVLAYLLTELQPVAIVDVLRLDLGQDDT